MPSDTVYVTHTWNAFAVYGMLPICCNESVYQVLIYLFASTSKYSASGGSEARKKGVGHLSGSSGYCFIFSYSPKKLYN